MISIVYSASLIGIEAELVEVQVDVSRGLPCLDVVGLPGASIREAKQRVRSALKNSKLEFPLSRIVVNLAPATIRKEGSLFDLPIALAIALATSQIIKPGDYRIMAIGELALDGSIRSVNGVLPIAETAAMSKPDLLILPETNANEAHIIPNLRIIAASTLNEAIQKIEKNEYVTTSGYTSRIDIPVRKEKNRTPDFCDVIGHSSAKRCLEIAAAGGHNLLMIGPPGSGKSLLASCIPGILPPMSIDEAIETSKVHSVAGNLNTSMVLMTERPFRSPHHTVTRAGLVGGGKNVHPGEISLAHNGVLFLDELGEFRRETIDALREPLETGTITICRHQLRVTYPCRLFVIAGTNPCPCGYHGSSVKECTCTGGQIRSYRSILSGPFIDRMDMVIYINQIPPDELAKISRPQSQDTSQSIQTRVVRARDIQRKRFQSSQPLIHTNSQMMIDDIRRFCYIEPKIESMLSEGISNLGMTGRGLLRCLKVARTIADIKGVNNICSEHIAEALQYRRDISSI